MRYLEDPMWDVWHSMWDVKHPMQDLGQDRLTWDVQHPMEDRHFLQCTIYISTQKNMLFFYQPSQFHIFNIV